MKIILFPVSLMVSCLILSGCGGGSDDHQFNQYNPVINNDFTFYEAFLEANKEKNKVEIQGTKITIKNNFMSINIVDGADVYGAQLQNYSHLTDYGLYEVDRTRYADGYRISKILNLNSNSIVFSPHNLKGYTDLQFSLNYKWIDISGQNILDVIEENVWVYGDLLPPLEKKLSTTVFPKGSLCLQISDEKSNKDYISIDEEANVNLGKTLQEIKAYYSEVGSEEGRWANTNWLMIREDTDYYPTYVLKDNKIYKGDYEYGSITNHNIECDSLNELAYQTLKNTVAQIK